jgi:hypothetical protein
MSDPLRAAGPRTPDAASHSERDAKVEQLLLVGLDHYFDGQYDKAINAWTRVLFLHRGHATARAYIRRARSASANGRGAVQPAPAVDRETASRAAVDTPALVGTGARDLQSRPRRRPPLWGVLIAPAALVLAGTALLVSRGLVQGRRDDAARVRARAFSAGGHAREALAAAERVRPGDPRRPEVDRFRAAFQHQLVARPPAGASSPTESNASASSR